MLPFEPLQELFPPPNPGRLPARAPAHAPGLPAGNFASGQRTAGHGLCTAAGVGRSVRAGKSPVPWDAVPHFGSAF